MSGTLQTDMGIKTDEFYKNKILAPHKNISIQMCMEHCTKHTVYHLRLHSGLVRSGGKRMRKEIFF